MDLKKILHSSLFSRIVVGLLAVILALIVFRLGMMVGYNRATFSYGLGDNYYRAFGRHHEPIMGLSENDLASGHGAVGKVVRVNLPSLVVAGLDNIEKVVIIKSDTIIREGRETIAASVIK